MPSVGPSLYGKLVEQLKLAGQPVPGEAEQPNGDQSGAAQAAPGLPSQLGRHCCRPPGDRPGERELDGWWEAIVLARDGDMLTLKWRDYPGPAKRSAPRRLGGAAEAWAGRRLTAGITARAVPCGPSPFPTQNS